MELILLGNDTFSALVKLFLKSRAVISLDLEMGRNETIPMKLQLQLGFFALS